MTKYAIVAIGYNRVNSIKRLLNSLLQANYCDDNVDLIISLDHADTSDVEEYAKSFLWPFGNKRVRTFEQRQGLKKHILSCGQFLNEYEALIVLEDDVIVSPSFYSYARETIPCYCEDQNIGGISLYSYDYNVNARLPFIPESSNYDVYFMQYAQSWGQIWLKQTFLKFLKWVEKGNFSYDESTPDYVNSWPDKSSWLKLHIKYCVDNNLFFVYPYKSFSTCFSDPGEHVDVRSTLQQVSLVNSSNLNNFKLVAVTGGDGVKYDAFFERIIPGDILIDLYGTKNHLRSKYQYVLTEEQLDYHIVHSYGLELKPHELNYILNNSCDNNHAGIYLYDLSIPEKNNFALPQDLIRCDYFYKCSNYYRKLPSIFGSWASVKLKKKLNLKRKK